MAQHNLFRDLCTVPQFYQWHVAHTEPGESKIVYRSCGPRKLPLSLSHTHTHTHTWDPFPLSSSFWSHFPNPLICSLARETGRGRRGAVMNEKGGEGRDQFASFANLRSGLKNNFYPREYADLSPGLPYPPFCLAFHFHSQLVTSLYS